MNMKFVNRTHEMKTLNRFKEFSKRKAFLIGLYGLRRVGKTRLVKEFMKNNNSLYFFVYANKTSSDLLKEYESELRNKNVIRGMEKLENWNEFVRTVFERCKGMVVVFDEFQNFWTIDPSIFSIFQRYADEYEDSPAMIILLGSLIGLFKNTFEDKKQPLYGRLKNKIKLLPMDFNESREMLKILGINGIGNQIEFYSLFGGFPKYYVAIEDFRLNKKPLIDVIEHLFLRQEAPLRDEIEDILKQELGNRKSLYYSILYAISAGKTKVNEIASSVGLKESSITRHLNELVNYFEFVSRESTVFEENKKTVYKISHPLIDFWFRYIYRNYSQYKIGYFDQIMPSIKDNLNSLVGRRFELVCKEILLEANLPFKLDKLGPWWGFHRDGGRREEIDIDIIGLNGKENKILFAECKWKEKVNAFKIVKELAAKAKYTNWKNHNRKEQYAVFAKSFSKKIAEYEGKKVYCFALNDTERILKQRKVKA